MQYPALFTPAKEGGYVVTFRDIPEAITQGDTLIEAIENAVDALMTAFEFYYEDGRSIPYPSYMYDGETQIGIPEFVIETICAHNRILRRGGCES